MKNLLVRFSRARGGYDCVMCKKPVAEGDPCVAMHIKKVKVLIASMSTDEEAHLACGAELHYDLGAVLETAKAELAKQEKK